MDIILYAMPKSKTGSQLEIMLKEILSHQTALRYHSIHNLIKYIEENHTQLPIVISVVERPKEFIDLYSVLEISQKIQLIIVCDDDEDTIALAHELRPRFLAHKRELLKVKAVVEKMLQSSR